MRAGFFSVQALGTHPCVTLLSITLGSTEKGQLMVWEPFFGYKHPVFKQFLLSASIQILLPGSFLFFLRGLFVDNKWIPRRIRFTSLSAIPPVAVGAAPSLWLWFFPERRRQTSASQCTECVLKKTPHIEVCIFPESRICSCSPAVFLQLVIKARSTLEEV